MRLSTMKYTQGRNHKWESSSSEKVAAIEGNIFWKSDRSKKVALLEK